MPRDHLRPDDLIDLAEKAARERLDAELKRALWAQQASRSWAALTDAKALQPSR